MAEGRQGFDLDDEEVDEDELVFAVHDDGTVVFRSWPEGMTREKAYEQVLEYKRRRQAEEARGA